MVVDLLAELARDMEMIERTLTLKKLKASNVEFFLETRVARVADRKVYLKGKYTQVLQGIDKIVLSIGMRSEIALYKELSAELPCHLIGDARQVSNAQHAIRDGFEFVQRL